MSPLATTQFEQHIDGRSLFNNGIAECEIKTQGKMQQRQLNWMDECASYRNLNKPSFYSVKSTKTNRVHGYANIVVLSQPKLWISEPGRQRVIRDQRKNVHAMVKGRIAQMYNGSISEELLNRARVATYNPYLAEHFFYRNDNRPVTQAAEYDYAICYQSNVYFLKQEDIPNLWSIEI